MMALALMGMGIRCTVRFEELSIHQGNTTQAIKAHDGRLCWSRIQPDFSNSLFNWASEDTEWQSVEFWQPPSPDRIWIVNGGGFTFGAVYDAHISSMRDGIYTESRSRCDFWVIPYWSIAAPVTLLAAYLILWKPRKRWTVSSTHLPVSTGISK